MKTKCILFAIFFALALPMTAAAFGTTTQNAEQKELKVDLNQASAMELQKLPGIG